jgi:nitroreductase/dihydropteridine reductase
MNLTTAMNWRYATKKFDPERVVSEPVIEALLETGNLAATSYGLQPFQFVVIQDQELRDKLVASSYGQRQVADASHVIVIATRTDVDANYISDYISLVEQRRGLEAGTMEDYKNIMIGTMGSMSETERLEWAAKQAYLVLGTMLAACAVLEIDSCPMEGFVPAEYDDLLGLKQQNLHAAVVLPVGYRSDDDVAQHQSKVRRPLEEMVVRI